MDRSRSASEAVPYAESGRAASEASDQTRPRAARVLRPPVEADLAVGVTGGAVAGVVDAAVVVAAEQASVCEVGGTALRTRGCRGGRGTSRVAGRSRWAVQPWSRMVIAVRWALVCKRRCRPMSRTSDVPPSTAGMIAAVQASRRASVAVIWAPVSTVHTPAAARSPRSCSRVMVTTIVAEQPPAVGTDLAGTASRSWQNARPCRTGVGRFSSVLVSVSVWSSGRVR